MGYQARVFADVGGLTEHDVALREAPALDARVTFSGPVSRNGQIISYTLDTNQMVPEAYRVMPEQIVMAAVLMGSFVAPLWHLLG